MEHTQNTKTYIYAFVRKDLTPSQISVQAAHACIELARCHVPADLEHPSLILLGVDNERQLLKCLSHVRDQGILCEGFRENDLGGQLTAFATEPVAHIKRKIFKRYQLLKATDYIPTRKNKENQNDVD